jgi:hypothetical protein
MFGQEVLDEINRVNPIIGYYTYEVPKASPEDIKKLKGLIGGQKSAVTVYTRNGKLSKAKKAQKKVDSLTAKLNAGKASLYENAKASKNESSVLLRPYRIAKPTTAFTINGSDYANITI